MTLTHPRAVAAMVGVTLLWSTAGVVTRQLASAGSFEVTFWRSFFTALSLAVLLPLWRGRPVFLPIRRGDVATWGSGACWCVMFTAFMVALTLTTVANVLVTLAIGPFLTAIVARFVMGHRLHARTWVAIAVAGAGIAGMYAGQTDFSDQWPGIAVALAVPLAAACNWTVVQHRGTQNGPVDLVVAVWLGAVLSALLTLPLAVPFQASGRDLIWLALLGVFQLAIPCVLAVLCVRVLKAPELALLALLEVIFGILLAWLGAGEQPGTPVLLGGLLVIAALIANELTGWKQTR